MKKVSLSLLLIGVLAGAFLMLLGNQKVTIAYKDGIPLPFQTVENSGLLGRIDTIGQKDGIPLRYLSFTNNETSEVLRTAVLVDSIDFAITPDDPTISDGAPLCKAVTAGKAFFGYEYTSATAADERAQAALVENGANIPFSRLFAGTFFASSQERARDSSIADFEQLHGVVFIDPCDTMKLHKDARYVIVANDFNTNLQVRGIEWCGNTKTETGEQCDDGNTINTDACTNACTSARCGDGIKTPTEQCDDGNTINTDACTNTCTTAICGDGIKTPTEQCDDGNLINTDSCTNACTSAICGDGIKSVTEQCDDGNLINTDSCTNACRIPVCGDGTIDGAEQCDDGNTINTDACTNQCTSAGCGDGIKSSTEECDDGNTNNNDTCTNACMIPRLCGDGIHQPSGGDGIPGTADDEQCDDGNTIDNDICDNTCHMVSPFTSSSESSSFSAPAF